MFRLYDSRLSGNSWKVRILLSQLGIAYQRITLDLEKGDTRTIGFQKISRFSRIPVLELEDGRTIVESGAILMFLAEGSLFLPSDPYLRAEVASWLFFEQADLQRAIAFPRVYHLRGLADKMSQQIESFQQHGYVGLEKLDQWLKSRNWLVADRYSLADIAVFSYVSMASQGGYEMDRFPSVGEWILRVKEQPGWIDLLDDTASPS